MDNGHSAAASDFLRPLEGGLVEICGLEAPVEVSPETHARNPQLRGLDANGERGRVIGWDEQDGKYVVETFNGVLVGVAEMHLQEFEPSAPEDGGFDVVWPCGPEPPEFFADAVVSCLAQKGYCLIQMFTSARTREEAAGQARELDEWHLPTKELEVPYLGYGNVTKCSSLPDDSLDRDPEDALSQCDRALTNLRLYLSTSLEECFGFKIWGRRSAMVRVPLSGHTEENLLRPSPLDERDYDPGGKVYGHVNFLDRQKLNVMYMVQNGEGGHVWLYPRTTCSPMRNVKLPITENKMLLVLPEVLSYSYKPKGEHLLLQTWYVSPPFVADLEDARIVSLPDVQQGQRAMIMSLEFRYAGDAHGQGAGWSMWTAGTDGCIKVPAQRFDIDLYCSAELNANILYTQHGACLDDGLMMGFDNAFFGIPMEEAKCLGPAQRNVLETGYEALQAAGYNRASLQGLLCGVYLGDAGTDWMATALSMVHQQAHEGAASPCICAGFRGGVSSSRVSYAFGLRGPCFGVDTACSSSLVCFGQAHRAIGNQLQGQLAPTQSARIKKALVMGICMLDGISTFIAYCAATMLSVGGRSFTFDEGANGFCRGEGCGACFVKMGDGEEDAQLMRACAIGANVNQDGRSASMTAPNGPSQQACIKNSMSESGLRPSNITIAECHGTGTALGDPIEVGALRDVMKGRSTPMVVTSAKSNFGHMEACAGIGGITKCVLMLNGASGAANLHLKCINPHIEYVGYPAVFTSELVDSRVRTGISGVSSFGVGGTNARADLWSRSMVGYLATKEVNTFQAVLLKSTHYARIKQNGTPGPCVGDRVCIMGTWDAWTQLVEMEALAEGEFSATVALGDACVEKFRIVLNEDKRQSVYPAVDLSGPQGEVRGPDWGADDRGWLLDGRHDDAAAGGCVFRVTFEWSFSWDAGEFKRVTWERVEDVEAGVLQVDGRELPHTYHVAGSWTSGKCKPMKASEHGDNLHHTKVRIGLSGQEYFHILRDADEAQVIHPAAAWATSARVPVRGPDNDGKGKYWVINGVTGDHVTIEVGFTDALIEVTVTSAIQGQKTWKSIDNEDWHDFFLLGSWSNWELERMLPERRSSGIYTSRITLGESGVEDFHVVVDRDTEQVLYPHRGKASLGEGAVCGPDNLGGGLYWRIHGRPHRQYEIVLNVLEEDTLRMVWWRELAPLAVEDS
uniref:Type I polyketide synthase n=1 Tax=Gambierdiscus excentricus TaxID=986170 RepID=A0A1S6K7Y9_9DINO|nr:type I polyketide synthase [Gambierdiscus excentricus]